jgi:hypothetical protein
MAFEEAVELVSAGSGADLTAASNQFRVVKLDANGNVVLAAAITDIPFGILYDTAYTSAVGKVVPVAVGGIAKVLAGATIPAGSPIATKADGSVQVAATTQYVIGVARVSAVAGDIFPANISTANVGIKA